MRAPFASIHSASASLPNETIALALTVGVPRLAALVRRRELLVETIDEAPAATSVSRHGELAAGGRIDYRGIVIAGTGREGADDEDEE
jgi:hypothetical protein